MTIQESTAEMLPDLEEVLKDLVNQHIPSRYSGMKEMIAYHMGWQSQNGSKNTQGKRIRPLIVLLATQLCGGEWQKALPAAASIELLHNFSLVHDDIEDQSEFRRGQPTVWKLWGVNQAVNCGDAMFSLAQISMLHLGIKVNPMVAYEASVLLNQTCISLTGGQYLDMSFESRDEISRDDYFEMITGKTAALMGASAELGAIVSQSSKMNRNSLRTYGEAIGIAFQVWDDVLGIWGNEQKTGKPVSADLKDGKKTLPVVYGFENNPAIIELMRNTEKDDESIARLIMELEKIGARKYAENVAQYYSNLANKALLSLTNINSEGLQVIKELTAQLIKREN